MREASQCVRSKFSSFLLQVAVSNEKILLARNSESNLFRNEYNPQCTIARQDASIIYVRSSDGVCVTSLENLTVDSSIKVNQSCNQDEQFSGNFTGNVNYRNNCVSVKYSSKFIPCVTLPVASCTISSTTPLHLSFFTTYICTRYFTI